MRKSVAAFGLMAAIAMASPAKADKLDDIIASGTLRCAVVLDFPPMGSRDANNNPIGFDVDYCNDLAKALGVKAEIVETPFPERIPVDNAGPYQGYYLLDDESIESPDRVPTYTWIPQLVQA